MNELDEDRKKFRSMFHGREAYIININRIIKGKVQGMITEFEEYSDPQYYIDISVLPHKEKKPQVVRLSQFVLFFC